MKLVKVELSVSELIHMVACIDLCSDEASSTSNIMSYCNMMICNARFACTLIDKKFPDLKETVEVVE